MEKKYSDFLNPLSKMMIDSCWFDSGLPVKDDNIDFCHPHAF
jgi:hypothetical protein